MARFLTTFMACLLVAAALFGVSATGAGAAGLGDLLPTLTQPQSPSSSPAEPTDPDPGYDADEPQGDDDPADDASDDDGADDADRKSFEPSAKAVGRSRARTLNKLRYVVSCPQVDCIVSVDIRIKVPGETIAMSSRIALIDGDRSRGFTFRVSRSERKVIRRAARGTRSVKVVARVVEWSSAKPKRGKAVSTKIH